MQKFGKICSNITIVDVPQNSWIDSTMNPKVKTTKGQGVEPRALACSILRVEGCVRALGWGLQ